jgi:hypothetical protein
MKYIVLVLLLFSILNSQSLNETVFSPLEMETSGRDLFGPSSAHKFITAPRNESSAPVPPTPQLFPPHHNYQQTQAGPPGTLPTTLSRVIDTKYGKVQGLSLTLFPSYQAKGAHPLRNKIVEVGDTYF